jgi:cobalamin biosynthesis protein CobD/CbiB
MFIKEEEDAPRHRQAIKWIVSRALYKKTTKEIKRKNLEKMQIDIPFMT